MTTMDKVEKALQMINEHDWWWAWAEYSDNELYKAYGHMTEYV